MANSSAFPTALDAFVNPGATDTMDGNAGTNPALYQDVQHSYKNDALVNVQARIGITGSAVASSLTFQVTALQATAANAALKNAINVFTALNTFSGGLIATDPSDTTKQVTWTLAGMTTGKVLTYALAQTTSATLNVPNVATGDTLATLGLSQSFSAINTFANATDATNSTTAGTVISGGLAVAKSIQVGTTGTFSGAASSVSIGNNTATAPNLFLNAASGNFRQIVFQTAGTNAWVSGVNSSNNYLIFDSINSVSQLGFTAGAVGAGFITSALTLDATTTSAAAFVISGGLAVGKKIISGSTVTGTQLISNIAIGTAPLVVTSTTNVANLNASSLNGATFAAPGAIGGTTAALGTFSGLVVNGAAGIDRQVSFDSAGVLRWIIDCDATTESGGNTGSGFQLKARDDTGALIDSPISLVRASAGGMTFGGTTARPATFTGSGTFSGVVKATVTAGSAGTFVCDNGTASTQSGIQFNDNGSGKWQLGKQTTNSFYLFDAVNSVTMISFTPGAIAAGFCTILNTTVSSTTSTGALVVQGGLGCGGNIFAAGTGNFASTLNANGGSGLFITQAVQAGGSRSCVNITPAANVSMASGAESISFLYTGVTRQFATSTPALQREWLIQAPTYACDTAAQTIANSATVYINGGPVAGTNVSLTNAYALYIANGTNGGRVFLADTTSSLGAGSGALVVSGGIGVGGALNVTANILGNGRVGSSAALTVFAGSAQCCLYRSGGTITPNTGDMVLQSDFSANNGIYLVNGSTPVIVAQFVGGTLATAVTTIPGTTSASSATVGAFVVGNGTAATSVAIGGGSLVLGNNLTMSGTAVLSSTASGYVSNGNVGITRGNSGTFAANSLVFQSGGTTTAGGGFYWGVNNGVSTSTVMQVGGTAPAANTLAPIQLWGRNNAGADVAGAIGETITGTGTTTPTNYTTTATDQQVDTVSLTAGKWLIYGFGTFYSNGATITAGTNAVFCISTVTASETGAVEGSGNIAYVPAGLFTGVSYRDSEYLIQEVNISATTSYFLNSKSTFTLGSPQFAGRLKAVRVG